MEAEGPHPLHHPVMAPQRNDETSHSSNNMEGPRDPRRMVMNHDEQWWAMDIELAIQQTPELADANISDFMIAQLAIVCQDNVEDAIQRALALQEFRQEYGIQDTFQDACQSIQKMLELIPNFYLSFHYSLEDGTYVVANDASKLDTTPFQHDDKTAKYWFAGCYYLSHAVCPDLASIRKGSINCTECHGMNPLAQSRKQDFNLVQKLYDQLVSVYPCTTSFRHYHTSSEFSVLASLLRKLLPVEERQKFQVGLMLDERLDSIYLVPTAQAATQRILETTEQTLHMRYRHEQMFRWKMIRL